MGIINRIKRTGLIYSFAIVFNRIVPEWLFRCRRFVVYQLDPSKADSVSEKLNARKADSAAQKNSPVSVRWSVTESDLLSTEKATYFQRSDLHGKLQGCLAEVNEQPAGGFWVAENQFTESELGVRIVLDSNQVWLFAARVETEFRKQGIYSHILAFILPELVKQGLNHQIVSVNPHNIGSNKIHQRLSQQTPGHVFAIRFLSTTFCWTSGRIKRNRTVALNSKANPIEIRVQTDDPA